MQWSRVLLPNPAPVAASVPGVHQVKKIGRIRASGIGPVTTADVHFGDLTVFVGPQATGKSIFLQLLKLLLDKHTIQEELRRFGIEWSGRPKDFLELYFGEGMSALWTHGSSKLQVDKRKKIDLATYAKRRKPETPEKLFFIPAQRVMGLRDGATRPFTDYRTGDPFVLRDFSEKLHHLRPERVRPEQGAVSTEESFERRATKAIGESHLRRIRARDRLVAASTPDRPETGDHKSTPLPGLVRRAEGVRPIAAGALLAVASWRDIHARDAGMVVIEEPEMGLHPNGIFAVLNLVLELVARGYRVCISTHSPYVLDVVWALRFFHDNGGQTSDVLDLLGLRSTLATQRLADAALTSRHRVYYFTRDGTVRDISALDPGSGDVGESGWGGLTEFSGRVGDVVAGVAARSRATGGS